MLGGFDRWQRRHTVAAFPVAVVRKFLDDRASNLAALIAYYAFFSLFPLLLVFVSVLGFVMQDNPSLQEDVLDSALARIPVIGAQLRDDVEPLTGSTSALVIGLAGALWAGLGVTLALGRAFDEIWDVPRTPRPRRIPEVLPGAALAAAGALALQAAGGWYVERAIASASDIYGTFALVIGLLSWFWLAAHLLLVSAEVNVVRHHRLWPRSLAGELAAADRAALGRTADAVQQDARQEIQVHFGNERESDRPEA